MTLGSTNYAYNALPTGVWVDSGTTFSWESPVSGGSNKQFVITNDDAGLTSPINAAGTDTTTYKTQFKVGFTASSNVLGDSSATVVMVVGSAKASGVLPFTTGWIDSGSTVTWAFSSLVASVADASGTRYSWSSTTGLVQSGQSGTLTVLAAGTVTGTYTTQYKVTFTASSLDSDAGSVTVLTVGASNYAYNVLPSAQWFNSGTSYIWASPITVSSTEQFAKTSGLSGSISDAATISAAYQKQWKITFTETGLASDAGINTVLTVGSNTYAYNNFGAGSLTIWANDHDIFSWTGNVDVLSNERYTTSASGGTVTRALSGNSANYNLQYAVTFAITPSGSGTTIPSGTSIWENAGALTISASQNAGFTFFSWSTTDLILFQHANQAQTTATINGPGTITAVFSQNLTTILAFSTVGPQIAGTPFSITVTAEDVSGNTIPWYNGTVHFTSTDAQAV